MKKIIFLFALIFACSWAEAQTYLQENFDTEIPATWTVTDEGGATGDSWISGQQGGGNSLNGTNCAIVDSDSNGNGTELVETLTSPVFDTTGATALFLDFDQFYNNIGDDTAVVEVFDGTNWVEVLNQTADAGGFDAPDEQHIDITAYSNAAMQVRFIYNDGNVWAWYWLVDNVQVYNSTCNFPSGITVTNITSTSADISWTAGGTETEWEVVVQPLGTGEPTGSGTATTDNPFTATGLSAITEYEVFVRANCGADGFSIWSSVGNFESACDVFVPEYLEDFTTIIPNCWDEAADGDATTGPMNLGGGDWGPDGFLNNGFDGAYKINLWQAAKSDWIISPQFDLTGGPFQVDFDFGIMQFASSTTAGTLGSDDTVQLFISTDNGTSWTNLITFDNTTVVPVTGTQVVSDLTAYSGQTVQFAILGSEGTVDDTEDNDVFIDNFRVRLIPSCQEPSGLTVANVGGTTADISWTAGGAETSWEYVVQPLGTGMPSGPGTTVAMTSVNETGLTFQTDYEVWVRGNCDADGFSSWIGPVTFTTTVQSDYTIDCTQPPTQINYCYDNNDTTNWTFTSTDGSPIRLTFNAGGIESCCDDILVYDGADNTAPLIYQGNNGGDLSGLQFDSTGDTMFMEIDADGSVSCASGSFCCTTQWDFTVACATCVQPEATYSVVSNCTVGPEFFVDVDLTSLGSATSITLSDDQGSADQTVSATGIVTFGPYDNNTPVVISVANDDDPNCMLTSESLTQEFCIDNIVDCSAGPLNAFYCYENNDANQFSYTSSDGSPVRITINSGEIEGDPFDFLVVLDTDGVTELYNGEGNDGVLDGLVFQSTGDTIFFQITSDGSVSCSSGSFCCSDGIDYTVTCATCVNPTATYQVIDDCDNGDQFLIDVNVASLGDATSLTISNNIDANTVAATAAGVYQVGPFPFGVDVVVTINNDQDANCVINSDAIQLLACPPDNDNPCDATVAGVNADDSCDIITPGTLLEATPSGIADGSCAGDPDDDVWFEFTAVDEFQIIQFLNITGGGFFQDLDHAVYEGTCDAPVELYCSPDTASLTPALTIGNTYYIRVFSAGDDGVDYTFDLCIRPGTGNVSVDQDTYTVEELVVDILIDSPCAQITNITFSTGTDFGDVNGIGYFTSDEGSFPFEDGIILTSGDASRAGGPNFNAMSDGGFGWPGDPELDAEVGINSNNASIIEFDFVPLSDEISFDFLMASEEYNGSTGGTFECTFSDAFAFLLTDEDGNTTNLAVLPGTNTPILVTNIHPENPGCPAINEEYFGGYVPQNLPPISFDGRTEVFTAFSEVNIGENYHIKLVIADATDAALDSGVFLKAGSFDIGEVELGEDITIASGTAACVGEQIVLETQALSVDHVWFKDGFVIENETSNTLVVTEDGTYTTQIIFSPSCIISDEILVEFLPLPIANMPPDLVGCSIGNDTAVFNLSDNDLAILGDTQSPDDFTVTIHLTEQDAIDGVNPLVSPYTSLSNPQTVYAQVTNNATGCTNTTSFDLVLGTEPETTFTQDFDYEVCPNATVPIIITATPVNYNTSEVTINWYLDGVLQAGENGLTFPVLLAGDYEIEVIFNDTGCSSITSQTVIELESCVIPQGISPNGDGMNDTFDLSSYRVTKLEIFNRLGTLVYSKTNYVDEWHGQTNDGEELPVGTYFYTMEYEDGTKRRSAWVYIQRLN
ncbi:choice-of-anchor L domain-containing protein [uncultured Psychroserpens sp.]|uniref:choice-of-anchor L domain-containing protein n=1 Tax=uncultured Psychroserpens sp. TaxID=255436 RepID=UPI002615EB41|nr:choice-of-anchor L domain-containing protein [uncultured Psychroserpens sp.]